MRKFMFLFVLCGLISGQAWGKAEFWMHNGTKVYCCGKKCEGIQGTTAYNIVGTYQLLGKTFVEGNGYNYEVNAKITCSNGNISPAEPNWCASTLFRRNDVPNARYCLRSDANVESLQYCLFTEELGLAKKGFASMNSCLYVGCKDEYIKAGDSNCLSKDEVAKCVPSDVKLVGSTKDFKKTSANNGVYCFKDDELKKLTLGSENQRNICRAGIHAIRDKDDKSKYWSCGTDGLWKNGTYQKCKDVNGLSDECNEEGVNGCELMSIDTTNGQVLTNTEGTGQTFVMNNYDTVCVRLMCNPANYVKSGSGCITIAQNRANVRTAQEKKSACQNSGGTWASNKCTCSAPHVSLSGNSCVCNSGYEWNADKKQGCKLTDKKALEEACNAAPTGTATWNDAAGACVCTNTDQTFDMATRMCKDDADFAACKPLVDRGVATWNSGAKQCVCNQPGYIVQNNNCIESPEAAAERERREKEAAERAKAEALRKSRRNISDAHGILVGMRETFKASVWKDEEGKFNTSRLVSDSIAGVVLGTVGGVVTSNVVKKNQVENGFEDIKCTVGGQTVADWGDEFRVGIQ